MSASGINQSNIHPAPRQLPRGINPMFRNNQLFYDFSLPVFLEDFQLLLVVVPNIIVFSPLQTMGNYPSLY
jgi:hypothetical protein